MIVRVKVFYLRAIPKAEVEALGLGDGADAAAAFAQAFLERFTVFPQRANDSDPGDNDSAHQDGAGAGSLGVSLFRSRCLTSVRTPSTMSRTLRIVFTSSSGTLISNSFSRAKTMLTPSMESMPSSSKLLSMVTCAGSLRWVSAMIRRTLRVNSSSLIKSADIAVERRFQNDTPWQAVPEQSGGRPRWSN